MKFLWQCSMMLSVLVSPLSLRVYPSMSMMKSTKSTKSNPATIPMVIEQPFSALAVARRCRNDVAATLLGAACAWVISVPRASADPIGELRSDEVHVSVSGAYVGIALAESKYKNSLRVLVDSVKDDAEPAVSASIGHGFILVSVGGEIVEGLSRAQVAEKIKGAKRPIALVFRDPDAFFTQLNSTLITSQFLSQRKWERQEISTAVIPANAAAGRQAQVLRVMRLQMPLSTIFRSADMGSVVEVVFNNRSDQSPHVDASELLFFPLGSKSVAPTIYPSSSTPLQSSAPLPMGIQMAMMGMVCNETRRIVVPTALNGPSKSSQGIYEVTLLSIDGENG